MRGKERVPRGIPLWRPILRIRAASLDRLFRAAKRDSLRGRMRTAQTVLVVLMLIPAVVSISLMSVFSAQYHSVITHMGKVSALMPLIRDDLLIELSDIVVGRTRFDGGGQFDMLQSARAQLDSLIESDAASRMELEVARRTLGTLERYVRSMGEAMHAGSAVDEDELALEEIRGVAGLFVDMLQDSINAEIGAAADASNRTQVAVRVTLAMEIALLCLTLLFAFLAQRSLSRAIREPLGRMERFAGRIAGGALSERVPQPEVEELTALTDNLNTMAFKLERLLEENTREQENLKKSEMRALQAQITPHFLYNTLDAIVWLAEAKRTAEVVQITRALSNFFRTSLSNGNDWITVEQEAEHLEGYLTIQQIRYRDILRYTIDIDEALKSRQILKLTIQPLVENAIYHGIKNRRGGGDLSVTVRGEGENLHVTVTDSGAGMDEARLNEVRESLARAEPLDAESGYGLYSVDKRLKLYYGQSEGLRVTSEPGKGTTVAFCVPIREATDG